MLILVALTPGCVTSFYGGHRPDYLARPHAQATLHFKNRIFGPEFLADGSVYSPRLYCVGSFNPSYPTVVFVPGANSPSDTFNKYMRQYLKRYNILIFFYNYLDGLDENARYFNLELMNSGLADYKGSLFFVAHSFGNNVLMKGILNTDKITLYQRATVIRLTPTTAGSRKAIKASRKFRQFVMGLISVLPNVEDFRAIAAAQDPLGSTIESLVEGYDKFKNRIGSVYTIVIKNDSHSPIDDSPALFKNNYRDCILKEALVLDPVTNDPHVEVLEREDIIRIVDYIVSGSDLTPAISETTVKKTG